MYYNNLRRHMSKRDYINYLITHRAQLCQQFADIPYDLTDKNYNVARNIVNSHKNNFSNILSSEESRIKLKIGTTDYINANYILDKYIATQQPNLNTHIDFWFMIYQENINTIINLSGNNDYLNINNDLYSTFKIEIGEITYKDHVQIRNIIIINNDTNKRKHIYHLTMPKWPDFGVPNEDEFLKNLNAINLMDYNSNNQKMVIHCRAGVGRTGTLILIHYLCQQFKNNNYPDIIETLKSMRKQRSGMIQDKSQFTFVLDVITKKLNEQDKLNNNFLKVPTHKKTLSSSGDVVCHKLEESKDKLSLSCEEHIIVPVDTNN